MPQSHRWNEKLERVARLEQNYAKAEQESPWNLTEDERASIAELSQDLPAIWNAETTTDQERKQLLRMVIESVQLDGASSPGKIEVQIRWRPGVITALEVKRSAPGQASRKTPTEAVSQIHNMAADRNYTEIAERLNSSGLRTAFGRPFCDQHVGCICRRDGLSRRRNRSRPGPSPNRTGPGAS